MAMLVLLSTLPCLLDNLTKSMLSRMCPAETGRSWFHIKLCQLFPANTWAVYTRTIKCIGWKFSLTVREQTDSHNTFLLEQLAASNQLCQENTTHLSLVSLEPDCCPHTDTKSQYNREQFASEYQLVSHNLVIKVLQQTYSQLLFLNDNQHSIYLGQLFRNTFLPLKEFL